MLKNINIDYYKYIIMNFFQDEIDIKELKLIIERHVNHILQLQCELDQYKQFYNAIMNNNVINERFNEYELKIQSLEEQLSKINS